MSTQATPTSTLGAVAGSPATVTGGIVNAAQQAADSVQQAPQQPQAAPAQPQPTSRLQAIISAVSTALSGIPDKGRPSFISGLGEGARAEQQAQTTQQDIKFKNFDQQVRLTQLHRQDAAQQQASDDVKDAQQAAQDFQKEMFDDPNGLQYNSHPNTGTAVLQTMKAQTAANGAVDVPPGIHLNADGSTINIPNNDPQTLAAQVKKYQALQNVIPFLPSLPQFDPSTVKTQQDVDNARAALGKHLDIMTNLLEGHNVSGGPWSHADLNNLIPSLQAQRDSMAKDGTGTPYQLGTLDHLLNIYKAQEGMHTDAENKAADIVAQRQTDQKTQLADNATENKLKLQNNAAANKAAQSAGQLDSVAFDPNYLNPDGSKGANVVMNKQDAQSKGLQSYKANPEKINATVAGFNDVQNKINALAAVANDPVKMNQVQAPIAAALLKHGQGIEIGAFGTKLDTSSVNEELYNANLRLANQATKDYVTAMGAAHEAITQLPRLQTFGQSSRMTQQQMEAAQNMLPHPGDNAGLAAQKMQALQTTLDPLRKQVPRMPGAELTPSWLEQRKQTQPSGGNLGSAVKANPTAYINSLQSPSNSRLGQAVSGQ